MTAFLLSAAAAISCLSPSTEAYYIFDDTVVTFDINTGDGLTKISPYIYGIADADELEGVTVNAVKQSSTALSTYNWETNYANSGAQANNSNDNSLISSYPASRWNEPALYSFDLFNKSLQNGVSSRFVTLPMLGYAAGDGSGAVLAPISAEPQHWINVASQKNDVLSTIPDINDNFVYSDEYVHYLVNKFGKAKSGGITGYFLDREPEYWQRNFPMLELPKLKASSLAEKSIVLAQSVKSVDSTAMVFGPSLRGLTSYISLNDAPDWNKTGQGYNWFIDYYLSEMRKAENAAGYRLLDVLDLHYYTESVSPLGDNVLDCTDYTHEQCGRTRMQTVRTLWDPDYSELSMMHSYRQYTPLIPILQASIKLYYPGTKLSFSEYNFGGGGDISGGIAEADALGCFASQGVYLACLSPNGKDSTYQKAAINLYTNYDGEGSSFGDTLVYSDNNSDENSSVFAAVDGGDISRLTVVASNKNYSMDKEITFRITSDADYDSAVVYGFDSDSASVIRLGTVSDITDNTFTYEMPPLSVYLFEITGTSDKPVTTADDGIGAEIGEESSAETAGPTFTINTESVQNDTEKPAHSEAPLESMAPAEAETAFSDEDQDMSVGTDITEVPTGRGSTAAVSDGADEESPGRDDNENEKSVPTFWKVVISLMTASVGGLMVYAIIIDKKI